MEQDATNNTYETPAAMQQPPAIYEPIEPSPKEEEAKKQNTSETKREREWISAVALFITIVSLGILVAILVILNNYNNTDILKTVEAGQSMQMSDCAYPDSSKKCSKSCLELRNRGAKLDGIYTIVWENDTLPTKVYCDMDTDGGGWTLVASVHENDIKRKCSMGDLWSEFVPSDGKLYSGGKSNWENKAVFGDVQRCTKFDYKNVGYYSFYSSDVMMWHVPSGVKTGTLKENIKISYRTTNNFLRTYGGNLRYLYEAYPLKTDPGKSDQRTAAVIKAIYESAQAIKNAVANWYDYDDIGSHRIYDTLLYDTNGNQVYFGTPRQHSALAYGHEYRFSKERFIVNTQKSVPFVLASYIPNVDRATTLFYIQVLSYAHYNSTVQRHQGSVTSGNYKLQYNILQFTSTNKPTPCEFYFIVTNTVDWKSVEPSTISLGSTLIRENRYENTFEVSGNPSNIVMGYVLLARESGNITEENTDNIAELILASLLPKNINKKKDSADVLTVPVIYEKGSNSEILDMVPPVYRPYVVPGYLQFRSYNFEGYANAICPGVRSMTFSPEYVCIGGLSNNAADYGTCGDFAGWSGVEGDEILMNMSSGSAHSQKDLSTTFLIFYR